MKEAEIKYKAALEVLRKEEKEFNSLDLCNCTVKELDNALEKLRAAQAKVAAAEDYKKRHDTQYRWNERNRY